MVKVAPAKGTIEAFLRTKPGPIFSTVSPQDVFRMAHKLYSESCAEPVELGRFTDHVYARLGGVEVVGNRYWLRLPGKNKDHLQIVNTPKRISE